MHRGLLWSVRVYLTWICSDSRGSSCKRRDSKHLWSWRACPSDGAQDLNYQQKSARIASCCAFWKNSWNYVDPSCHIFSDVVDFFLSKRRSVNPYFPTNNHYWFHVCCYKELLYTFWRICPNSCGIYTIKWCNLLQDSWGNLSWTYWKYTRHLQVPWPTY